MASPFEDKPMTAPKIVLTTVLTTLTALVFAVVLAVSLLPAGAIAHGGWQSGAANSGGFGRHFGGRHGASMADRCERMSTKHTRVAGALATAYLDLDDEQSAALQPLLEIADRWRSDSQALCLSLATADNHSVQSGMVALEQLLSRSAEAVADMQPAYAAFEATLNVDQRDQIQTALNHEHNNES